MTDDEIMKALRICKGYSCNGCPMGRKTRCRETLMEEALKLIKKLKGEKMNCDVCHIVSQTVKCDTLFVNYSDDSVRMFNAEEILKDRETMGKETFFRVYGFDVDVEWLREAGGLA